MALAYKQMFIYEEHAREVEFLWLDSCSIVAHMNFLNLKACSQ